MIGDEAIKLEDIENSSYNDLAFDSSGYIRYKGQIIAILTKGDNFYNPFILVEASGDTSKAKSHLEGFLAQELALKLQPIFKLKNAEQLNEKTQYIVNLLLVNYGIVRREVISQQVKALDGFERTILRNLGIRFGRFHIYLPHILKPLCAKIITLLMRLHEGLLACDEVVDQMLCGKTTIERNLAIKDIYYKIAGYDLWDNYAIRVDITERLANYVQEALNWKAGVEPKPQGAYKARYFFIMPQILSILGVCYSSAVNIFKALGYINHAIIYDPELAKDAVQIKGENEAEAIFMDIWTFVRATPQKEKKFKPKIKKKPKTLVINYDSPFAVLAKLTPELLK